ncbi:YadA-like family protein [Vibrio sp. CyArs1]|uniref:YadA-like family protein n=1 Tax=Vibrio sp. CyArs1 TaxID=2682577 RepID=UPI001F052C35|nr:YadA-like family protein [Vibrio sp. CyArs1]
MKKLLLVTAITSVFTGSTYAAILGEDVSVESLESQFAVQNGRVYNKVTKEEVGLIRTNSSTDSVVEIRTKEGAIVTLDKNDMSYKITETNGELNKETTGNIYTEAWKPNNKVIDAGESEFEQVNVERVTAEHAIAHIVESNNLEIKGDDIIATNRHGEIAKVGEKMADGSYAITDPTTGESIRVEVDDKGNATHVNYSDGQGNNTNAKIVDNDMKPMPNPIDPTDQDRADTRNDIADNQKAIADGRAWAVQAEQRFNQEVKRLDSKIDKVEGRVSNGVAMVGAMSQMQFGQGGFGIGAGAANFNGSNAIAIGAGYNFGQKEEWIIKGSFGYAETNKGNAGKIKDTMVAGGVTYTFK